jgi:hypothetical protein
VRRTPPCRRSHAALVRRALTGALLTLLSLPAIAAAATSDWTVHPVAGNGTSGTAQPGNATASPLSPGAIALDPSGNLYLVDNHNPQIDKVTPQGTLSVFAGDGTSGLPVLGGQASATQLDNPSAVAADNAGNVFIADNSANRVYKVDPAGVITLFAGNGSSGTTVAGTATSVPLDDPNSLTTDASGDVYIATYDSRQIVKVTPAGQLTLVAGNGSSGTPTLGQPATSQPLGKPGEMAVDAAGDLLEADYSNQYVYKIAPDGIITSIAGTGTGMTPTSGQPAVSEPTDSVNGVVVRPDGNIDLSSPADNALYEIDTAGNISVVNPVSAGAAPTYGGPVSASDLDAPGYLAMSPAGALYVTDANNNTVDELVPPAPVNVSAPSSGGTATPGQTLTATQGQWIGDDISYSYQWQLCDSSGASCASIGGATSSTYTPSSADAGASVRVVVTASNAGGSATATSPITVVIAATPPTTTTPPTTPTTTSGAGDGVSLSKRAAKAGVNVSGTGGLQLPLICLQTATGCDADGQITLALTGTISSSVRADAAVPSSVIARFTGIQIEAGHSRLVAVTLTPAATRYLQTRGIRRVRVTLTTDNHLSAGPVVTNTEHLWLNIAALRASCPAAVGSLTASSIGQMRLRLTRGQAHRLGRYRKARYGFERYCLTSGAIRVAYTNTRLLKLNPGVTGQHAGRIDLALTANHHYIAHGIRTRMTISQARTRLHLERGIAIGKNTWYFAVTRHATTVIKARDGIIRELGVASRTLTRTRAQQRILLRHL